MEHYKYVVVVLVYRNIDDLKECIYSVYEKITDSKIIVVNSYYDEESKSLIEDVAKRSNCVFLNVENKGYSYGNNRGIEYARNHLSYEYLIISNPDITVREFDDSVIDQNKEYGILAPKIISASGRLQNPMSIVRSKTSEKLEYIGFKNNNGFFITLGICVGKIMRGVAVISHRRKNRPYQIYTAHGSFVIITKSSVDKLYPIYDENVFLFAEEGILAHKAERAGIKTGQFDSIVIDHKEDGSMKLSDLRMNDELRKANLYYYENYL